MREIEVKARLVDEHEVLVRAKKLGIAWSDPIVQEDTTYLSDTSKSDPSWNIFRVRKQGSRHILTMKYKAPSIQSRDNYELESDIAKPDEVIKMLERLGYVEDIYLKKTRRKAAYKGYEICLDDIDGYGAFIEVEKMASDDESAEAVYEELWTVLKELGVDKKDAFDRGYDMLVRDRINKPIPE